jgi:ubiquinone/menaquinone biosynthesis C-methylase UbiE
MSDQTYISETQQYFQRVMDDWRPKMDVEHPYAQNRVWLRTYHALRRWIRAHDLEHGRVLEIGCGTGLLQHLVPRYVGTDLATTSAAYMQKPFCACSATRLPFDDNTFDGLWTVWVLEHIDQPEQMLAEMRRVVKPGGTIFLSAAYAVDSWVSQGIHKRPFRDLSPRQRLTKLTIPVRRSAPYKIGRTLPRRLAELLGYLWRSQPTALRYRRLQPNYEMYWDYDADAVVSLDSYSVALYFLSRGDEPRSGQGLIRSLIQRSQPQIYTVRKPF